MAKLKDKKFPAIRRRFTWEWLSEQPNFVLIQAALDTAHRLYRSRAHHASSGSATAPGRLASKRLQRRYAKILGHLAAMLKA